MKDYRINVVYSQADGGYIADIPDLRAGSAFGETPAEALAQLELARAAWLEAAHAEGKPIPRPRERRSNYQLLRWRARANHPANAGSEGQFR